MPVATVGELTALPEGTKVIVTEASGTQIEWTRGPVGWSRSDSTAVLDSSLFEGYVAAGRVAEGQVGPRVGEWYESNTYYYRMIERTGDAVRYVRMSKRNPLSTRSTLRANIDRFGVGAGRRKMDAPPMLDMEVALAFIDQVEQRAVTADERAERVRQEFKNRPDPVTLAPVVQRAQEALAQIASALSVPTMADF